MAVRAAGDWLSSYLEYTDNTEPPTSYHVWSGISTIAGVLQRKVWMEWGHECIYPNMYIVLIGPSGRCRKGTAMNISKHLLKQIKEITVSSESITREALIRVMKNASSTMTDPQNPSISKLHCSITVFSEELSVFLGQNDLRFLSTLTDWYDSRDRWSYETKGTGKDSIEGVCVNLLGGTAPDWLQSILPEEAIGGGFTSRIIFIVEERKRKTIANPILTPKEDRIRGSLIRDLEQIMLLKGKMIFTPQAQEMYENWYEEQDINTGRGVLPINDPRFAGYCERRPTHIKKLSMIISASRGNDMVITEDDFDRAQDILLGAEKKMMLAFGGLGASKYGQITEKILRFISGRGKIKRSQLMILFYRDVDPETLLIVETTLQQMKVLKVTLIPQESDAVYEYIGKKGV